MVKRPGYCVDKAIVMLDELKECGILLWKEWKPVSRISDKKESEDGPLGYRTRQDSKTKDEVGGKKGGRERDGTNMERLRRGSWQRWHIQGYFYFNFTY